MVGTTLGTRQGLSTVLLDLLKSDPEWAAYVAELSPSTPLRRAVEDYLRFVKQRVAPTRDEAAAADQILAMMAEFGYRTPAKMAEAIESGTVSVAELASQLPASARGPEAGGA